MAARTAGRKGRPFVRAQLQCFAEEDVCCFCGRYVDQTLPNYRSGQARSVHHLIPPDIAPHLANSRSNLRLSHLGCNARYGRGAYKGQGLKPGRIARGSTRAGAARATAHTGMGVRACGTVAAPERDW